MIKTANELMGRYGMKILDIRIIKLNFPEVVRPKIHERMIAEQEKRAEEIRAEGRRKSLEIDGKRERIVRTLEAEGTNQANRKIGQAKRKVADIFNEAYEDEEFFGFYQNMQTYEAIGETNPKLILSNDNPLLKSILNGGQLPEELEKIVNKPEEKQDKEQ